MHVFLPVIGSAGDVFPFIGVGAALVQRGHRVTMIANSHFEDHARRHEMEFVSLGTEEAYRGVFANPDLWHWKNGLPIVMNGAMTPAIEPVYAAIRDAYQPGETVVACSALSLGAMMAHEKLGVPVAMMVVGPMAIRSAYDSPVIHPYFMVGLPPFMVRFQYWLTDFIAVDAQFGKPVNDYRVKLGLKPVKRVWDYWTHSLDRVICLFPDWFAPRQSDWPAESHHAGFVTYDGQDITPPPQHLQDFLAAGDKPIVFTVGSAGLDSKEFFSESIKACELLGKRGLLMTPFADQAPHPLPAFVCQAYAPFSWLFSRVSAIVHHGGIGTMARAMQAGIPQLAMPLAFEQPDNARRIQKLGVGGVIARKAYRAPEVARRLREIMESPQVAQACREGVDRVTKNEDALAIACQQIEALAATHPAKVAST